MVFVTAHDVDDALEYYRLGADYVILPHFLGSHHVSLMLESISENINKLIQTRLKHIEELNMRKRLGHHHPKHQHG